ncbi:hypothetical protein B0H16DRAFT_1350491, partial [Mycena metata]
FQPGEEADPEEGAESVPWAFDDHPAVRNAYIRAFVGAAFEGMTRKAVGLMLDGARLALETGQAAGVDFPGLSDFARTLPTVEKRLGVSTDNLITYFFICDACWYPHHPTELKMLDSSQCDQSSCTGTLYTTKRLSSGSEKRTPILTLPFVAPEKAIQRMCLQPGKVAQWQEWRGPDDVVGERAPSERTGYAAFDDPDKPMKDIMDGWGWRAVQAGLERRRNGTWEIRDVDVTEIKQQFVALPNGLIIQINVDWFQAVKNACHSTGALYATVCNNPRGIRFLREETSLLMIFPGPHEPTSDQYNNVTKIFTSNNSLGMFFDVHGKDEPELFHAQIASDVSDLPASRKTSGTLACTSKYFMCDRCETPFYALVDPDSFDSHKLKDRDPWRYLKYSFRAHNASEEVAEEISRRRGIRYSVFHELSNWLPGETGLIDPMHCIFGSQIKHLCKNILHKNGMVDGEGMKKMEQFFEALIWPPSISRLPPSVARGAGSIKADQWRSQIAVFFVALFMAWEVNGEIPDIEAEPPAANTKIAAGKAQQEKLVQARMRENLLAKNPDATEDELEALKSITMDRSLRRHYEAVVQFTAAVRILTSNSISPNEVERGCDALERTLQEWARMHCHLVPYSHLAVHLRPQYYKHGPVPGWWTFPYERDNGFLGRFNHNGHSGGEMEGTMMRGWWKTTLIQDLISRLEAIENPAPQDLDSLNLLKSYLKGGTSERKGTLQQYIAKVQSETNPRNLRQLGPGYYNAVFEHLLAKWASEIELIPDVELSEDDNQQSFLGDVESFSHVWISKQRYGAGAHHRGKSAQYGYIDGRIPVHIEYIFRVSQTLADARKLVASCAVVRRFQPNTVIPDFPWDFWATDIGVRVWKSQALGAPEIISLEQFSGHFILAPVTIRKHALWITIAYDHVCSH